MTQQSFMEYWLMVDTEMYRLYGTDTSDIGTKPEEIAAAQEGGDTPAQAVAFLARQHLLTLRPSRTMEKAQEDRKRA